MKPNKVIQKEGKGSSSVFTEQSLGATAIGRDDAEDICITSVLS